jgi:hypothetical protein
MTRLGTPAGFTTELARVLAGERVHRVDALMTGDDFVGAIQEKLQRCALMLALIGKRWLTATDDQGDHDFRTRVTT